MGSELKNLMTLYYLAKLDRKVPTDHRKIRERQGKKIYKLMKKAYKISEDNGKEGIRVIAVAQKNEIPDVDEFSSEDEKDMVLLGFIGFLDPPKESAVSAIEALKNNGIKTVVLTGDSKEVAINICNRI